MSPYSTAVCIVFGHENNVNVIVNTVEDASCVGRRSGRGGGAVIFLSTREIVTKIVCQGRRRNNIIIAAAAVATTAQPPPPTLVALLVERARRRRRSRRILRARRALSTFSFRPYHLPDAETHALAPWCRLARIAPLVHVV